jgi:MFS transporter, FSR family, fosmidomycin resistance protein
LLAAYVLPRGQASIAWFSLLALVAIVMLVDIGAWTARRRAAQPHPNAISPSGHANVPASHPHLNLSRRKIAISLVVLIVLMFSKFFYLASLTSYYTFYLMGKFQVSVQSAQIYLFIFLGAVAAGTFFGGPVGDRLGRKFVIWYSILGVLPFTLLLPYANLFWTAILSIVIGLVLASAFSTILVFAQELVPGRIGTVSGFFFGLAFGLGGIGAALLGKLADLTSINFVYHLCSFLPALGILTAFLPNQNPSRAVRE